tara:strand:+ start:3312 stop:4004 length:693 start_codon:yes stop_codon:yes gene_type:complete
MYIVLGNGLLGSEICKESGWVTISRKDGFDFNNNGDILSVIEKHKPSTIVNCIANTDTYSDDKELHWKTNYESLAFLVDTCVKKNIKLVHISTDYVYTGSKAGASENDVPVHCNSWYGYTKLIGDAYVQLKMKDYLIIRCSHKPYPFPYSRGLVSQVGNFDYVDVITSLIVKLINKNRVGIYNVGTEPKTVYELAKQTSRYIKPMYNVLNPAMPTNITMDITKMKEEVNL